MGIPEVVHLRASTDTDSMEISMRSTDTMLQPQQVTSPTADSGHSLVDQQVMDQFTQMRSMLSSFLRQKLETTTRSALCYYLATEVEGLGERHLETRLSSSLSTFKARQKNVVISPSSHSNRQFHIAQVQLQCFESSKNN